VVWFGPDALRRGAYAFYAGALDLPSAIQKADILTFDRASMWMAFNYVANYSCSNIRI